MKSETVVLSTVNVKDLDTIFNINEEKIIQDLTKYAKHFLAKEYGLDLTIPIKISKRMSSSHGLFYYTKRTKQPLKIVMQHTAIALSALDGEKGLASILDTFKHELVHYALCSLGKDFNDGDEVFENELYRLGISSSGRTKRTNNDLEASYYGISFLNEEGVYYKYSKKYSYMFDKAVIYKQVVTR